MLNPIEEAKFAKLRVLAVELGVPSPPEIMIGLKVHDKNGTLVFDDIQRGHSWTRNFYNMLFASSCDVIGDGANNFGAGYMSGKRTDATLGYSASYSTVRANTSGDGSVAVLGAGLGNNSTDATFGVVVGTDNTAFSAEQYGLIAIIASGNGAGQFAYNTMAAPVASYTAGTKTWKNTVVRIFNNNSGGSITVKEVGLIFSWLMFTNTGSSPSKKYLMERSVLSPTVAVANGAQLTVTYEVSMDFSAID